MSRHERSSPSCTAIPPQIRRQCNFAPGFKPTNRSDVGTDQRRAAKCVKNAAFPGWLAGHCLVDYSPKLGGVWPVLCQASGQRSDEVAVAVEPQNLEPGHPPLPETLSIVLDRALLRCIAHCRLQALFSNISNSGMNCTADRMVGPQPHRRHLYRAESRQAQTHSGNSALMTWADLRPRGDHQGQGDGVELSRR